MALVGEKLERAIGEQQNWIEEHGSTLPGYVERYGSADDPQHYGNGGEAIYEADVAELRRLESLGCRRTTQDDSDRMGSLLMAHGWKVYVYEFGTTRDESFAAWRYRGTKNLMIVKSDGSWNLVTPTLEFRGKGIDALRRFLESGRDQG